MKIVIFTERVGFAAALKNIEVYIRDKVNEIQIVYGQKVKKGWEYLSKKFELEVHIGGIDPLGHFSFEYGNPLAYKTYVTQEMLKKGYIASNSFYTTAAHGEKVIDEYLSSLDDVFKSIAECIHNGIDITTKLEGPCCQAGFQRLNG